MIKKLRWKFIKISMASVFAILLLIIITINIINISNSHQSVDTILELLIANDGKFKNKQFDKDIIPPDKNIEKEAGRFHNKDELPFSTRFFTVSMDKDYNVIDANLNIIASVDESNLDEYIDGILSKKRSKGWYENFRYQIAETDEGYLLVAIEATSTYLSIISVAIITSIVGLSAFLLVFLLVALLSKRAIKPISETYEKQKQFITNASHELKTPLTVISSNAEILNLTYGDNEWCSGIIKQSENMRSLITKMIQMSKLDESQQSLISEPFNISDAVYDTVMSFKNIAESKGLTLSSDIAGDIIYKGDESAIRQLSSILTDNALKYCDDHGEIYVSLSRISKSFGRERIQISFRNTFKGVNNIETSRLFDRFYRADQSHSSQSSFGLGLSIARYLTEQHGGSIEVLPFTDDIIEFKIIL